MSTESDRELIRSAVATLERRAEDGGGYAGLSAAACGGLCRTLAGVADESPELDRVPWGDAVDLAHRVLADDHPEASPLWPDGTG